MLDLKKVRPCKKYKQVDGELEDGRLVEFKINLPRNFDKRYLL